MNIKKIAAIVVLVGTALNFSQQTKASDKIDCNALLPIKGITQEECNLCPNREFFTYYPYWMMNSTSTSCSLKECPSGYMSVREKCHTDKKQ